MIQTTLQHTILIMFCSSGILLGSSFITPVLAEGARPAFARVPQGGNTDPRDWRSFNPYGFKPANRLVPSPRITDMKANLFMHGAPMFPHDPSRQNVIYGRGKKSLPTAIYAKAFDILMIAGKYFQTPAAGETKHIVVNGESIELYGTSIYTPLQNNSFVGNPTSIAPFDPTRVFYKENKMWPSVIYAEPGTQILIANQKVTVPAAGERIVLTVTADGRVHLPGSNESGTASKAKSDDASSKEGKQQERTGSQASANSNSASAADKATAKGSDGSSDGEASSKAAADKAAADKAAADKASADKAAADKAAADKAAADKAAADKASADKAAADKAAADKATADKASADKASADKAPADAVNVELPKTSAVAGNTGAVQPVVPSAVQQKQPTESENQAAIPPTKSEPSKPVSVGESAPNLSGASSSSLGTGSNPSESVTELRQFQGSVEFTELRSRTEAPPEVSTPEPQAQDPSTAEPEPQSNDPLQGKVVILYPPGSNYIDLKTTFHVRHKDGRPLGVLEIYYIYRGQDPRPAPEHCAPKADSPFLDAFGSLKANPWVKAEAAGINDAPGHFIKSISFELISAATRNDSVNFPQEYGYAMKKSFIPNIYGTTKGVSASLGY